VSTTTVWATPGMPRLAAAIIGSIINAAERGALLLVDPGLSVGEIDANVYRSKYGGQID